jgi:hypothetical protein
MVIKLKVPDFIEIAQKYGLSPEMRNKIKRIFKS